MSFECKTIEGITFFLLPRPNNYIAVEVKSCVHPSLHPNCYHEILFAKFNLIISYPPPYFREA